MCLSVGWIHPTYTANRDLTFYKVVFRNRVHRYDGTWKYYYPEAKSEYVTPYRLSPVTLGETYEEEGIRFRFDSVRLPKIGKSYSVHGGGFHLYCDKEDADVASRRLSFGRDAVVLKAIVPKGTKYVKGVYDEKKCVIAKAVRYELIHGWTIK